MQTGAIIWEANFFKPLKNLVEEIIEILTKIKWSESKLAYKSGIKQSTINRILIGETKKPAYTTIQAIVEALKKGIEKYNKNKKMGELNGN